jgi:hypothetical protein
MNPELASRHCRPLLFSLLLLGLFSAGGRELAAAPMPLEPALEETPVVIGAAVPWQVAPALLVPDLMPEAYYGQSTSAISLPQQTNQSQGSGSDPGDPTDPSDPSDPGGVNRTPEPATLVTALLGTGLVGFCAWRRRMKRGSESFA